MKHSTTAGRFALQSLTRTALASMLLVTAAVEAQAAPEFIEFESGHVRPLALSPDGTKLFAVNTPNNTLEVYNVTSSGLQFQTRIAVGMEPVAVAARSSTEVWVVNHLSDSVSVVSLDGTPRVTRTLVVGDEPRDIVFAGSPQKAFITTAHRGQQRTDASIFPAVPGTGDPQLTTPGVERADVWVFSTSSQGNTFGGTPIRILTFFADTPRALAVSPDNNTVYVAAHKSGNQTTAINEQVICNGWDTAKSCVIKGVTYPGGNLPPKTNAKGQPAPKVGMIVKWNGKNWVDSINRIWDQAVLFTLPDKDVFSVNANTLEKGTFFQHVGTTLYNMAVNPVSGALYVSNTDSNNATRFEGPGKFGGSTVQGNIAKARVTVIKNGSVQPRHLNKHIDYSKLATDPSFDTTQKNHTLSIPMDMAVTKDGSKMYVTAFGSSKIGVYNTSDIENDSFQPRTASANYITVSGGGPSGIVLDEARGKMYVTTRFDNSVKVIDLASKSEVAKLAMPNPETADILNGRKFLYDGNLSSANGEASCASCHIFGDEDALAWDLGNPDDEVTKSPIPGQFVDPVTFPGAKLIFAVNGKINGSDNPKDFHPMKGPMVTQSLRGLANQGAEHWRGDRATGKYGTSATDEINSFVNFGVAFSGLLGNKEDMSKADMTTFANFMMKVTYPPNPIRKLDRTFTDAQKRGADFYFGDRPVDGFKINFFGLNLIPNHNCNGCHLNDANVGKFGTSGEQSFEGIPQIIKIAQLRNIYQKVGRFGAPAIPFSSTGKSTGFQGDQVRGYGFVHDGTDDTMLHFFQVRVFNPTFNSGFPLTNGDQMRSDVGEYMHAFDSDLAPIVGQQVTVSSQTSSAAAERVTLLETRAEADFVSKILGGTKTNPVKECEVVAYVVQGGVRKGYLYNPTSGNYTDKSGSSLSKSALRALGSTAGQEVTYTAVPPGSGNRVAFRTE